ncbi:M48 family metalloprotease [Allostreptomyces psammosilenae]|uniref:STE24 endopeptidase n=1 Tax=Allostreptomyces psammosilenae TaxID=1892865 RepID=A0A853A8S8_9ACTN|nr:M48 family metalloprotease [Allostreptomyces psammosilenae]NYI07041.1 STE24 endopeptidase [Allostreptomyces psammosilenae]
MTRPPVPRPEPVPGASHPGAGEEVREPGGARAVDAADPALDFTPEERARGRRVGRPARRVAVAATLVSLAATLSLGLTPAGAGLLRAVTGAFPGGVVVDVPIAAVLLCAVGTVVRLPFAAALHRLLRRHGPVTQGWAGWWADRARSFLLAAAFQAAVLAVVYTLLRAWPERWWLPGAGIAAVAAVLLSAAYPLVVEPVFNRFRPLPAGPLREALLDLAARARLPLRDVLVADASRRSTALNAYVSGLGATRRVVVHDTLVEAAPTREIVSVAAHELGHVAHRDVAVGTVLGAVGAAATVVWTGLLLDVEAVRAAAGVRDAAGPESAALLLALVAVPGVLGGPLGAAISRRAEARADRYALDLTRDPAAFVAMQRRLAVAGYADLTPNRLLHALLGTHPTTVRRIAAARRWAARNGVPVPPPLVGGG